MAKDVSQRSNSFNLRMKKQESVWEAENDKKEKYLIKRMIEEEVNLQLDRERWLQMNQFDVFQSTFSF